MVVKSVRAVVFDLYDTLIRVAPEHRRAHQQRVADALGLPLPRFAALWAATTPASNLGELGGTATRFAAVIADAGLPTAKQAELERLAEVEHEFLRESTAPIPGLRPVLERLRAAGIRIGLVSNCSPSAAVTLDASGLRDLLDVEVLSCEVALRKPDPAIFRTAADRLGVDPAEAVYVGDGMDDELAGAASIGMRPVRVTYSHDRGSAPAGTPVAATAEQLGDMLERWAAAG